MVEELLENDAGDVPEDFKFYTFAGKVHVVQLDLGALARLVETSTIGIGLDYRFS